MAVKTHSELITQANIIKNEVTIGANSATRVGTMFVDAINTILNPAKAFIHWQSKKNTLVVDCGGIDLTNVALQIVYWNKKYKCWRPVSGAGVKSVYVTINASQVSTPSVTAIRCKLGLTTDITTYDFTDPNIPLGLFEFMFLPFYNLKKFSFYEKYNELRLMVRNTKTARFGYYRKSLVKTGLAVTKSYLSGGKVKTVILSDPIKFNIYLDVDSAWLFVSFKDKVIQHTF